MLTPQSFQNAYKSVLNSNGNSGPDYVIGIFDGKLGHASDLSKYTAVRVSENGLPVFKSKE